MRRFDTHAFRTCSVCSTPFCRHANTSPGPPTVNFDIQIDDEDNFSGVVHSMAMDLDEGGGLRGAGAENTQQAADLIAQDPRIGVSVIAHRIIIKGAPLALPTGTTLTNLMAENEPK